MCTHIFVCARFSLAFSLCVIHACCVKGFGIRFSTNTHGWKFIVIKTPVIFYNNREFVLSFLRVPLSIAACQVSRTETLLPAPFEGQQAMDSVVEESPLFNCSTVNSEHLKNHEGCDGVRNWIPAEARGYLPRDKRVAFTWRDNNFLTHFNSITYEHLTLTLCNKDKRLFKLI